MRYDIIIGIDWYDADKSLVFFCVYFVVPLRTSYFNLKIYIQRAKRMSEFYFDVGAWEKDVEDRKKAEMEEEAMGGRKRKRPTKQDLVSRLIYYICTLVQRHSCAFLCAGTL